MRPWLLSALVLLGCGHTQVATLDAVRVDSSPSPRVTLMPSLPAAHEGALARQLARIQPAAHYQIKAFHRGKTILDAEIEADWTPTKVTLSVADTNVLAGAGSQLTWDGSGTVTLARGTWREAVPLDDTRLKDLRPILPLCALSLDDLKSWHVTGATTTALMGRAVLELQLDTTRRIGFYLDEPHVAYIEDRDGSTLTTQLVFSGYNQFGGIVR